MYPSVLAAFFPFSRQLEGDLKWMYLDILGWVTTGIGNKIDPVGDAVALPWKNQDGSLATTAEVTAAWNAVDAERSDPKGQVQTSGLATHYGGAFGGVTTIRLTSSDVRDLVNEQLAANELTLRHYFPGYDTMPADAQMELHSRSWALGAGFAPSFPLFTAAMNAGDYAAAAKVAAYRGVGITKRLAAEQIMLQNAAQVVAQGLDRAVLYYPGTVPAASTPWVEAFLGAIAGAAAGFAAVRWRARR